ncbi:MAG: hypothetical protein ABSB60_07440 [Terracidiphilus sp.]|jgi:hypothetical protein
MKAVGIILSSVLLLFGLTAEAREPQQDPQEAKQLFACTPKENVDWNQLNPILLDQAFDLLEDLNLQADALDKSDEVYAPRETDSEKQSDKVKRAKASDADSEVFCPLAVYKFAVNMHRLNLKMPGACSGEQSDVLCHSMSEIRADREKAQARLDEIQRLYRAAQQKKPEPPAKKGTKGSVKG